MTVFRLPPPSALMVKTGTTTSWFPRTVICSPPMGQEQPGTLRPSVGAEGWCGWTRRERSGISMTRWWPALLLAPPAQMRAPPTARTQTLPLWTQTTCERTPKRNWTGLELEKVEAALFGWAAAVCRKLHMRTVTHPPQIPDSLFLFACL